MSSPAAAKRAPKKAPKTRVEIEPDLDVPDDAAGAEIDEEIDLAKPIVVGKRGRTGANAPVVHDLFVLDDVMYTVTDPTFAVVVKYVRDLRRYGRNHAVEDMCFTMLGEEALSLLAEHPDTGPEDLALIFTKVSNIFFDSPAWKAISTASGKSQSEPSN